MLWGSRTARSNAHAAKSRCCSGGGSTSENRSAAGGGGGGSTYSLSKPSSTSWRSLSRSSEFIAVLMAASAAALALAALWHHKVRHGLSEERQRKHTGATR